MSKVRITFTEDEIKYLYTALVWVPDHHLTSEVQHVKDLCFNASLLLKSIPGSSSDDSLEVIE